MLPLFYFLKVVLCSVVFFVYYLIALRNNKFHNYNRFYLLFSVAASWIIPLLKFQITSVHSLQNPMNPVINYIAESNTAFEFEPTKQITSTFNWMQLLPSLYFSVAAVILIVFMISLFRIYKLYRKYPKEKIGNIVFLNTTADGTPFSFFRYIFWNNEIDKNTVAGNQILEHELIHIHEKHSWDKIFIQINLVFGWFNPCLWLIKKELGMIHEFIADKKSITNSSSADFASMLLLATFPKHQYKLTNPFFFSPIKRRLTMLTQNKTPRFTFLRRLNVVPLFAIVVLLFAFRKSDAPSQANLAKTYKIVLDAGHGGTDPGCKSSDGTVYEKDINLAIVKAIKQLNNNKNIEVILTRDDDHFDDLNAKTDFINNQKADLCLSIHCSDAGKDVHSKGTEIYIVDGNKDKSLINESKLLAQSVNGSMKNDFISRGIKSNKQGIKILQATQCPAILIEAGFLSNKDDAAMLNDVKRQNLIATDILKGIEHYLVGKERR